MADVSCEQLYTYLTNLSIIDKEKEYKKIGI